jgi:hypothetical protein
VLRGQSHSRSWRPAPLALGEGLAPWFCHAFTACLLKQEGKQVREASPLFIGAGLELLP